MFKIPVLERMNFCTLYLKKSSSLNLNLRYWILASLARNHSAEAIAGSLNWSEWVSELDTSKIIILKSQFASIRFCHQLLGIIQQKQWLEVWNGYKFGLIGSEWSSRSNRWKFELERINFCTLYLKKSSSLNLNLRVLGFGIIGSESFSRSSRWKLELERMSFWTGHLKNHHP